MVSPQLLPKMKFEKTLGATESLDWEYYSDSLESIKKLKNNGYTIVSIEQANKSENLENFKPKISKVSSILAMR